MMNGTGTILSCVGDINKGTYQVAYHITIAVGEQLLRRAKGHYHSSLRLECQHATGYPHVTEFT